MTVGQAKEIIKTIKFLNFKFSIEPISSTGCSIVVSTEAPDTRDRKKIVTINYKRQIRLISLDTKDLILLVFDAVMNALKHEAGELFLVNNVDIFNEHNDRRQSMSMVTRMFKFDNYAAAYWDMALGFDSRGEDVYKQKQEIMEMDEIYLGH